MKRLSITSLFLSLLLLMGSCASSKQCPDNSGNLISINIIDHEGLSQTISNNERLKRYENVDFLKPQPYQKVLRVYGRDPQGNSHSYITSYYPNGQPRQYLEVINNRAYGIYREWFSNGVLKLEGFIIGGEADLGTAAEKTWLFEDCCKVWDENAVLIAEIRYFKGLLDGFSTYYHSKETIWKQVPFCNGKIEGTLFIYLENGSLFQSTDYNQGRKNGPSIRYWDNMQIAAEETYSEGLLITGRYHNHEGEIIAQIDDGTGYRAIFGKEALSELQEYHQGILDGEVKAFGKNGRLLKIYHMKNHVKHGEEVEYYDKKVIKQKPAPKLSINWYDGKIQGLVKTWYDNGVQESQREMSANIKNGLSTAWYRDGSLQLIEEYDHEKLVKGEYYQKGEKEPISTVFQGDGIVTLYDSEGNFLRKMNYHHGKPLD